MPAKLDYQWHLRELMARQGMFSTTALQPLLAERGVQLSTSQVYRLVTEKPERLSLKVLMALLDVLGCSMDELIEPVASTARARKAAGAEEAGSAGVGAFRPRRARIRGVDS
ncbi:helix-turn-helix domain-containing protein [Streptomyces sp. NPDC057199]|uniref:helix-turn-helix domain-containing protein n=1 Tax=Streptomyces sp. NPDC057199 TaxID=3346047 RepID=UPI003629CABA